MSWKEKTKLLNTRNNKHSDSWITSWQNNEINTYIYIYTVYSLHEYIGYGFG